MSDAARVDIVVALVRDGDRILVQRRAPSDSFGGYDEFPGGRREAGESLEAACAREVLEETGLDVTVGASVGFAYVSVAPRFLLLTFFDCRCIGPTAPSAAAVAETETRWIELRELADLRFPPANREIVAKLLAEAGAS